MSVRQWLSRLLGLIIITVFALAVMFASGTNWLFSGNNDSGTDEDQARAKLTPTPVLVIEVERHSVDITDQYSGLLEPLERFRLAFEINGRIEKLGANLDGSPLDDGDIVRAGQALAILDRRALEARVEQAQAQADQAEREWQRAERLNQENTQAITEAEYFQRQTDVKIAQAQLKLAQKTLDDATLVSKIDGVISRRMVNPGESVAPQQVVFEVVQTDSLLLVVGVPESRITAIIDRFNEARRQALRPDARNLSVEEREFIAQVSLIGKDPMGRPWQPVDGIVRRIAQTADETSGLFAVEIEVSNDSHRLRPGQIAIGQLIIDRVEGVEFPLTAAQFTDNRAFVYSVDGQGSTVIPPEDSADYLAVRHELGPGSYLEQGANMVVFDFPASTVVLRGQHRLVDGRPVKVLTQVDSDVLGSGEQVPVVRLPDSGG